VRYAIDGNRLVMTASDGERATLRQLHDFDPDGFDSDCTMYDVFGRLVTSDGFSWTDSDTTGDFTAAPMLAVLGDEEVGQSEPCSGLVFAGRDEANVYCRPVVYRWAFMAYQVTTPQRELMERGEVIWEGGRVLDRPGQDLIKKEGEIALGM
jgi:hypothetical protein